MASIQDNFIDSTYTASPIPTTGTIIALTPGVAGFGNSHVIGQTIECNSLQFNHLFQLASQVQPPMADVIRTIVFVDRQANSGTPAVTDVLVSANINSHFNFDYVERFYLLYDDETEIPVTAMTATACAQAVVHERFEQDLRRLQRTIFQQGTMTVTTNNIYVLLISASAQTSLAATTRMQYRMF